MSPGIELRSADFSPLRSGPPKTARHLWARCSGDEMFTLGTHAYEVVAVAFLPDGRLVSGSLNEATRQPTVKLWELRSQRLLVTDSSCGDVSSLAVSSDGKLIAVATWGPRVELFRYRRTCHPA